MFKMRASSEMFLDGVDRLRALDCTPEQLQNAREICESMCPDADPRQRDRIIGAAVLLVTDWCDPLTYTAAEGARVMAKKIGKVRWDGPVPEDADYTLAEFRASCQEMADQALFIRRALRLHLAPGAEEEPADLEPEPAVDTNDDLPPETDMQRHDRIAKEHWCIYRDKPGVRRYTSTTPDVWIHYLDVQYDRQKVVSAQYYTHGRLLALNIPPEADHKSDTVAFLLDTVWKYHVPGMDESDW